MQTEDDARFSMTVADSSEADDWGGDPGELEITTPSEQQITTPGELEDTSFW